MQEQVAEVAHAPPWQGSLVRQPPCLSASRSLGEGGRGHPLMYDWHVPVAKERANASTWTSAATTGCHMPGNTGVARRGKWPSCARPARPTKARRWTTLPAETPACCGGAER